MVRPSFPGPSLTDFLIDKPSFDIATGVATFRYQLDGLAFTETLTYPEGGNRKAAVSESFAKLLDLTAIVLGLFVVGFVGFSHVEAVHNAAHDTRHANAFPCH